MGISVDSVCLCTDHVIVSVLCGQVQGDVSILWDPIDSSSGPQQHKDRISLALPCCIVERTHTCRRQHIYDHIQWLAKVFTPLGIFPTLLPYNLELKWIFGRFVLFDLHNMSTTLKMQNIFYLFMKQTRSETKITENLSVHNYSSHQSQYFVEPPFAAITAASLLGYVSISLAHPATGIFAHSSRQNCSSSLDGFRCCTAIVKSYRRFSIGLWSGLWLGHSKTCLGPLSCWKVNLRPSLKSQEDWNRFPSRITLYLAPSIIPSILTSVPVPANEKNPHSIMLPPPCFTGIRFSVWWEVLGLRQP